jgi:hypothetical protein
MKFKKHISLFLVFFILVSNMGLVFNVHYCGGEMASISLKSMTFSPIEKKSCCGMMEKKSHCCKDKVVAFHKKSDHVIYKVFSFNANMPFLIVEWQPIVFLTIFNFKKSSITSYFCDANAPPFFKLYRQYILYA